MKHAALILLLLLSIDSIGQKKYEFDFTETSLDKVVEQLSKKHKLKFSYNPDALKEHYLHRRVKASTEAELISKIFEDLPFKIQLSDGVYLVIPKKIEFKPTNLAGQVLDKHTGKPLAFAHVQSDQNGTISNQEGKFSLPPREDTITLQISYIGYEPLKLEIPPNQEIIALNLEQNPQVLQEVILNSEDFNDLAGRPSFFSLNPEQFDALPTLGETDVFKAIQLLPGIRATDETASGLSIRGSSPSQNLILMDGFTLYHLDHFFGIFSTLNPNVINNVNVYKGAFGPEYGGRMSSVVDVSGKTGSMESFRGGAGLNLLSFNGYIETPIGRNSSLLFGGRRSFTGILNSNLYKDFLTSNRRGFLETIDAEVASLNLSPSFNFYDFNGKFQHRFNDKSSLDVNFYLSEDFYSGDFEEGDEFSSYNVSDQANWANSGVSLSWSHQIKPNWYSELTVSASEYADNSNLAISQTVFFDAVFEDDTIEANSEIEFFNYDIRSSVGDFTIKSKHEIALSSTSTLKAGLELSAISTDFDSEQLFFIDFSTDTLVTDTLLVEAQINSLYGGYQFANQKVTANVGLRANYYEPAEEWFAEPRLDLKVKVGRGTHLKGAASYHHQFINQTSLSATQTQDKFYWVLADGDVVPIQRGPQLVLGADYSVGNWTFDIEYYRKSTRGVLESQFLVLAPIVLDFVDNEGLDLAGKNISRGLDVFLKYKDEKFNSWISYSLGESNDEFWYRNDGNPYPSNRDQRHELNFVNIVKLGKWELSNMVILGTGKPFTPPNPNVDEGEIYDLTRINQERLPHYSRIDLSAKYSFKIGKSNCETGATFFNILDRRNIKSRNYTRRFVLNEDAVNAGGNVQDQIRIVSLDTNLLGFTPNFFFNIRF